MYLCSVVIMAAEVVLMQLFARQLVQLISGSTAPLVLENGARYLMWNAPFYAVLGVLLCTRYALQSLGQKVLPLFSSVIELVGKGDLCAGVHPALRLQRRHPVRAHHLVLHGGISRGSVPPRRLCVSKKESINKQKQAPERLRTLRCLFL